jgi:hypothetical protein
MSNLQIERELYDEIRKLIDIPYVMHILDSSDFFKDQYLKQTFKTTDRFKIDKIHRTTSVPLKKSLENRLIKEGKNSIKFSSYNNSTKENVLQLSNFVEQKPKLKYFTMGSKQNPDQFEGWIPEKMYNWWFKLRTSGIPKLKWKILDAVFFLFINQISCICNSYIKYGIKNNSNNKNFLREELELLSEYFRLLDDFYKSGGKYGKLLDTHISFCNWFQYRIRNDKQFKSYVEYQNQDESIFKLFNKKNENKIIYTWSHETYSNKNAAIHKLREYINNENNFYLILFTSYFQSPSKFISLYSIPVITVVGVPHKSHNAEFYSPFSQIGHDFFGHSNMLLKYLIFLYDQKIPNDIDINIFRKKMMFLQLLSNKKDSDAQLLFWYIIHELEFGIKYSVINRLIPEQEIEKINWSSLSTNEKFKIRKNIIIKREEYLKKIQSGILSKHTANVNKKLQYLKMNYEKNIYKFFDIEILLEQLKLMKIFLIELTPEEKKQALSKIIHSIDVLIETCEETIRIERNKNYNNYMRQRQSNLPQNENFNYTSG